MVLRTEKDKRSAWIKWAPVEDAYAYNIYIGTAPDKLYNCIMVYNSNEYWYKGMDKDVPYYFSIEAINESGVSKKTRLSRVTKNALDKIFKHMIMKATYLYLITPLYATVLFFSGGIATAQQKKATLPLTRR